MNERAGRLFCVLGCAALAACRAISVAGQAMDQQQWDPLELQQAFGRAKDLKLVTSVSDIPVDGRDKLAHLALYGPLSGETEPLADIGMEWSPGDAMIPGLPSGQHRFTAVSDELLAIMFVTGGTDIEYRLIVAPRNSRTFCLFRIPPLHPSNLRLSVVQQFIRPDRDQTLSKTPKCQLMALDSTPSK